MLPKNKYKYSLYILRNAEKMYCILYINLYKWFEGDKR